MYKDFYIHVSHKNDFEFVWVKLLDNKLYFFRVIADKHPDMGGIYSEIGKLWKEHLALQDSNGFTKIPDDTLFYIFLSNPQVWTEKMKPYIKEFLRRNANNAILFS